MSSFRPNEQETGELHKLFRSLVQEREKARLIEKRQNGSFLKNLTMPCRHCRTYVKDRSLREHAQIVKNWAKERLAGQKFYSEDEHRNIINILADAILLLDSAPPRLVTPLQTRLIGGFTRHASNRSRTLRRRASRRRTLRRHASRRRAPKQRRRVSQRRHKTLKS